MRKILPNRPPHRPATKGPVLPWWLVLSVAVATGCGSGGSGGSVAGGVSQNPNGTGNPQNPNGAPAGGNAGVGGSGNDNNPSTPQRPVRRPSVGERYDVVGIVGTGQSLSVGVQGNFCSLDTEAIGGHVKLADAADAFDVSNPNANSLYLLPLTEPIRPFARTTDVYPQNLWGVTPHSAMAHQLSALSYARRGRDYPTAPTVVGESGRSIEAIRQGGKESNGSPSPSFAAALFEVAALRRLLAARGQTYAVGGTVLTHGETDYRRPSYRTDVYALQQTLQANVRSITGQPQRVPLFLTQQSSLGPGGDCTTPLDPASFAWSRQAAYRLALDYPDDVILVGPKYQYAYAGDYLHMVQAGYRALGEKNGQIFDQVVERQQSFLPTLPQFAVRKSATVLWLPFVVPQKPLVFDEQMPPQSVGAAHHPAGSRFAAWANGKGFELLDAAGTVLAIANVALDANATGVVLTSAQPLPTNVVVQYAMTQDANSGVTQAGLSGGAWGKLRDSDPFLGRSRNAAYCKLTTNSSVISCQSSLWFANVNDQVQDENGNLLAYVSGPNNASWSEWSLTQPWTQATVRRACYFPLLY